MNKHNFLHFNLNNYRKHLSPFGQNVLDTLIKHWRTDCGNAISCFWAIGFDKENRPNLHQPMTNNNRRNIRRFHGDSRSIPSMPSSPVGDTYEKEIYPTINVVTDNHSIPKVQVDQASDPSYCIGKNNYETDVNQVTRLYNDHFAIPRIPAGQASEPSASITSIGKTNYENIYHATYNANSIIQMQHDGVQNDQRQMFNDVPDITIKQTLRDCTHELANGVVPVSGELVKTVEIPNTNEEEILTANDMITPAINFEKVNGNGLLIRKHIDKIDCTNMPPMLFLQKFNETIEKENQIRNDVMTVRDTESKTDVEWDNMFDTDLIPDLNNPLQLIAPLGEENCHTFKIGFPKDKKRKQSISDKKFTKRKTQTKICDTLSKKVKKVKCEQNVTEKSSKKSYRKMKYTKVVTNWLNFVDPEKIVEDKTDQNNLNDEILSHAIVIHETINEKNKFDHKIFVENQVPSSGIEKNLQQKPEVSETELRLHIEVPEHAFEEITQPEISALNETLKKVSSKTEIEKNSKGKTKKVIQARLAQKDGKMKFGPPAKEKNESKPNITMDNETKNKETTKEKKAKAKFVAPIKSQIPVKNVTFHVNTIDDSNVHLLHDVVNAKKNDIAMILIYCNGFCQLNDHHTEDTCVPEGVMIQSRDQFFYVKDNIHNSDVIKRLIENSQVICYNGKELLIYLTSKYGIELKQDAFNLNDAKIGGNLVDPDNPPEDFAELQKLVGFTPEFTIATECVLQKAAWYTTLMSECFDNLKSLLIENSVWNVFVEIEMRLLPVIAGMEYRGVCVDLDRLKSMEEVLLTKMKTVEQECYKAAGKTFQINSALQVRTILYDELHLDTKSNLKIKETTGKGVKSTSETMLRGLVSVHPLPRLILEYRHLHKAHATFLTGIAHHVKDGLVKPTWVQTAAATGRIASNNPNLQAIPKATFSLVMFPETYDDQEPQLNFRCVYRARPGHWLLAADFKHVECRVFAHAAADAALLGALRDQRDLFRVLAAKWLNKPVDGVSTEDRERTKRIVYASLYGAGARKLMEILHVSYEQALSVMTSFNRTFPALKAFGAAAVARARSGPLRTQCGRARRFRHIASADAALRAHAERQAVNFLVQGSAADLCKAAMVAVQARLERRALRGRLLLQIHDELVWEVADDDVHAAAAIIKDGMENVGRQCGMELALPVELTRGRSWGDMRALPAGAGGAGPEPMPEHDERSHESSRCCRPKQ